MLYIKCPHCGMRSQNEFLYGGDASIKRPNLNKEISKLTDKISQLQIESIEVDKKLKKILSTLSVACVKNLKGLKPRSVLLPPR